MQDTIYNVVYAFIVKDAKETEDDKLSLCLVNCRMFDLCIAWSSSHHDAIHVFRHTGYERPPISNYQPHYRTGIPKPRRLPLSAPVRLDYDAGGVIHTSMPIPPSTLEASVYQRSSVIAQRH